MSHRPGRVSAAGLAPVYHGFAGFKPRPKGPRPRVPGGALNLFRRPPDQCPDRQFNDPQRDHRRVSCFVSPHSGCRRERRARPGHACSHLRQRHARRRPRRRRSRHAAATVAVTSSARRPFSAGGLFSRQHHHPRWHVRYYRPIWYWRPPGVHRLRPAHRQPRPRTCLSKEYTPEGSGAVQGSLHQRGGDESLRLECCCRPASSKPQAAAVPTSSTCSRSRSKLVGGVLS